MHHATAPTVIPTPAPRIARYEQFGFGLFVHWGLYSQFRSGEWLWTHHQVPRADYLKAFKQFDAKGFDALALVRMAKAAGCRYVCLTTRHHEGFSLYDTRGLNTYDSLHAPAKRDLVREFSDACEAEGLGKFFYHTTLDWWHADFDRAGGWDAYLDYLNRSVEILCTRYGKVDGLWFDGNWARRDRDWKESALYALIRTHQPNCIIVNNSSVGALGAEGHPEVDVKTFEQGQPGAINRAGKAKYLAAEMCDTVNSHWGISVHDCSHQSPGQLIRKLAACRKVGANYLLNVGPDADGSIPAYERALLEIIGRWTAPLAKALTRAKPTALACRGDDFVLQDGKTYWYFAHDLPINENMHLAGREPGHGPKHILGALPTVKRVTWADSGEALPFTQTQLPKGRKPPAGARQAPETPVLTFTATPHPYGHQRVIRVAKIETA